MSPDMVADIIALCQREGTSILSAIATEDGPPKPLAFLSREFISDADFPEVFAGMMLVYMAAFRAPGDFDYYEKILRDGCMAPGPLATAMAKQIETWDPITRTDANGKKVSLVKYIYRKGAETIRQGVNWLPKLLGINWENDQQQDFDTDRLYEMRNLGKAFYDLAARARLTRSQARITSILELPMAGDPTMMTGDPVDMAELEMIDAAQPFIGSPVPAKFFGAIAPAVSKWISAHKDQIGTLIAKAIGDKGQADPVYQTALERMTTDDADSILPIVAEQPTLRRQVSALQSFGAKGTNTEAGDVVDHYRELFGDDFADAVASGDIVGAMNDLMAEDDTTYTTGDPTLDENIIASTLTAVGDLFDDSEVGGLFKRKAIKNALKKAGRYERKNVKFRSKQNRRMQQEQALAAARARAAAAQALAEEEAAEELPTAPEDEGATHEATLEEYDFTTDVPQV